MCAPATLLVPMLCVLKLHYGGQARGAYTIVARRVPARSVADELSVPMLCVLRISRPIATFSRHSVALYTYTRWEIWIY